MWFLSLPKPRWWMILVALILQLLFNPCWHSQVEQWFDIPLLAVNCLVVVLLIHYVTPDHPVRFAIGLTLGTPIIVLYWIPNTPLILGLIYLFTLLLYAYVLILALPRLLGLKEVATEQVAASLAIYILIGMVWAILYYFIEIGWPGSFATKHGTDPLVRGEMANFVYFSFVTLTTLGYGDFLPTSCLARSFAILEAVCGVACLSFVVARLVGLSIASNYKGGE